MIRFVADRLAGWLADWLTDWLINKINIIDDTWLSMCVYIIVNGPPGWEKKTKTDGWINNVSYVISRISLYINFHWFKYILHNGHKDIWKSSIRMMTFLIFFITNQIMKIKTLLSIFLPLFIICIHWCYTLKAKINFS